jgi:hypothetical protein
MSTCHEIMASSVRQASIILLLTAALTLGGTVALSAQSGASQYLYVVTLDARPDMISEFENHQRQIAEARRRVGDQRTVYVYQTRTGGPVTRFRVVLRFDDYAELDSWPRVPELLARAYGAEEGARMAAEGLGYAAAPETRVNALQPDHTSGTAADPTAAPFIQVVTTVVDPALESDYRAFLVGLKASEDARGLSTIRRTSAMGEMFTYYASRLAPSYGELMQRPPPGQHLEEDQGRAGVWLIERANAAVRSRTIEVIQLREDLSYFPSSGGSR